MVDDEEELAAPEEVEAEVVLSEAALSEAADEDAMEDVEVDETSQGEMDDLWKRAAVKATAVAAMCPKSYTDGLKTASPENEEADIEAPTVDEEPEEDDAPAGDYVEAAEAPEVPDTIVVDDAVLNDDDPAFAMDQEELTMDADDAVALDEDVVEEAAPEAHEHEEAGGDFDTGYML